MSEESRQAETAAADDQGGALSSEELRAAGVHPGETPRQFFWGLGVGTVGCFVVSGVLLLTLFAIVVVGVQVVFGGLDLLVDSVWGHEGG